MSPVLRSMRVPPSERATTPPPARNERVLNRLAPQMMPSTTMLLPTTAFTGEVPGSDEADDEGHHRIDRDDHQRDGNQERDQEPARRASRGFLAGVEVHLTR